MKKIKLLSLVAIPFILLGCGSSKSDDISGNEKIQVEVSINPLKEFAQKIGGDKVSVSCFVPDNVEPHEYELKTRDFESLSDKDLFIYNGFGIEEWLDDVKNQTSSSKIKYINASEEVDVREEDGKKDPHIWLSLKESIKQCEKIKNSLQEIDSKNKDYYEDNYNNYKKELDNLYDSYNEKFNTLKNKSFITSHEAFGYLCRDFGLKQQYLNDMFGEGEPTAKKYQELAEYCKENNIDTIFSEGSESSKEAETLAKEINGQVKSIFTLETKVDGKTYTEVMKENYDSIYESLSK